MNIVQATREYETWLAQQTDPIAADIRRKHSFMGMGNEVGKVHLGTKGARAAISKDLKKRKRRWS
jgi:hypothetical protein